jgi:DNA-binding transcriptional ArsR family regulator
MGKVNQFGIHRICSLSDRLEVERTQMIQLQLSALDLTRTRFACSPLWETVMGYGVMRDPSAFAIHLPWVCEAREVSHDLDLSALEVLSRPNGHIPDFLTPPPTTPLPDFEDELRTLLNTDPNTVRLEVQAAFDGALPEVAAKFLSDPTGSLERLAESLRAYWQRTLEPHWPRLRMLLENDILTRARSLALGGPTALFRDLNPLVTYEDGLLSLDKSMCSTINLGVDGKLRLEGRGLLLMPSAFVWPKLSTILSSSWQPTLAYTPRGVANLWMNEPPATGHALELLLGRGRAEVLLSLELPSSTLELARRLQTSASGISEHLGVLRQAGLVESQRRGRFVYYRLSQTGTALIGLLGAPHLEPVVADRLEVH